MLQYVFKPTIFIILLNFISCVSSSKYKAVEYTMVTAEQNLRSAKQTIGDLQADTLILGQKNRAMSKELASLKEYSNYSKSTLLNKIETLEKKLVDQENVITGQDRYLLEQTELLRNKETELSKQKRELDNIKTLLRSRNVIADTILIRTLRALPNYEPQDLNIYKKNGEVYLMIAEAMLFKNNSINVTSNTNPILQNIGRLLNENTDLTIQIEVHTDDKTPSGMKDNWHFTNQRALSIAKTLIKNGVQPYRIAPVGKSQYFPIDDNSTKEGRQRNRRTVIILQPNLEPLNRLLNRL